jgi:hypothetical protein
LTFFGAAKTEFRLLFPGERHGTPRQLSFFPRPILVVLIVSDYAGNVREISHIVSVE